MRLLPIRPRGPKWIVISAYIGPRKKFKGLTYDTRLVFYRKKLAEVMASVLNNRAGRYGIGKDFEFRVAPTPDYCVGGSKMAVAAETPSRSRLNPPFER